jgi:transposase
MIPMASGVRVWIATGHTDMRRGMNSLALTVQEALKRDPHGDDLYVFCGKNGKLIKILWHDGQARIGVAGSRDSIALAAASIDGHRRLPCVPKRLLAAARHALPSPASSIVRPLASSSRLASALSAT